MNKQRNLLVVSGPSGAGKDTVVKALLKSHPEIKISISATTRQPRQGEKHTHDYYFMSHADFEKAIQNNELVEYTSYCGNYYGTLFSEINSRIDNDISVILVIEVEGAANMKRLYPECTSVFVMPPSQKELSARLHKRGTEDEEHISARLKKAEEELKYAGAYDYQVVNIDYEDCAKEIYTILMERQGKANNV